MKVQLKYFASIREAMSTSGEAWQTECTTLAALRDELAARDHAGAPAFARGRPVRIAQNQVMCAETAAVQDGAEIAFFPPVTGG